MKETPNYKPPEDIDTPYRRAGELWDRRIGSARVQARNWRMAAFIAFFVTALSVGGLIFQSVKASVIPYVVEVDTAGTARLVGAVNDSYQYRPKRAAIEREIEGFVRRVRSLSTDPLVVRRNWLEAYMFVTRKGKNRLNAYAREADPFGKVGEVAVSVTVNNVHPITDDSFEVKWVESVYNAHGTVVSSARYTGVFVVTVKRPRDLSQLRVNPLGIFFDGFSWSKDV